MKLKLLTTTAIIGLSLTSVAKAEENTWFESMTQSVQSWFNAPAETTQEVEAYLDEVTIAVPPMTGEDASAIEPAAGDYQESLEDAIENIPGSVQNQVEEQSFNTDFSNNSGSIAAFEDGVSAEDLANIMPAAGDAEEIVEESIVVATEEAAENAEDAANALKLTANDLNGLNVIDQIVREPLGGAHRQPDAAITTLGDAVAAALDSLSGLTASELRQQRRDKFLAMGTAGIA